ncbi:MAG: hypothetical protein OEY28_07690 [Nitrospira sp.]|nr:hypothetical protein [Nitrospira sp.]
MVQRSGASVGSGQDSSAKEGVVMKKWVLIGLLLIGSGTAHAGWVSLGGDHKSGMTIYIDASAIAKNGDQRSLWILYDFKKAQAKEGGLSFQSAKMQREYDCKQSLTRLVTILHYAGSMETGKMVLESKPSNQDWASVGQLESGTIAKDLWTLACGGE